VDQLVFVHGVATRKGADYDLQVGHRDTLFPDVAWQGKQLHIRNPYWGALGADFSHGLACLPGKGPKAMAFGVGGDQAGPTPAFDAQPLAALAEHDFGAAVDAIFVAMIERAEATGSQPSRHRGHRRQRPQFHQAQPAAERRTVAPVAEPPATGRDRIGGAGGWRPAASARPCFTS
jgi:hypothetical protein